MKSFAGDDVIARMIIVLLCAALIPGCDVCGGDGGSSVAPTPPTITRAGILNADSLTFAGGSLTIQATVTDSSGVATVDAAVTPPGGGVPTVVNLDLSTGSLYSATYDAVANLRSDGQAETYTVVIKAADSAGNKAQCTFTFSVPAANAPPPGP